jgi:predicted Zn finger-like uncharacterized protein
MALATQCPHCHTRFRVAADQLKLRGGIVRCGACQGIFDGNAHLIDLDAPPPAQPAQQAADSAADDIPVYTVELGHAFEPLGILPRAVAEDHAIDQTDDGMGIAPPEPMTLDLDFDLELPGPDGNDVPEGEPQSAPEPEPEPEPEVAPEPAAAPEPAPEAASAPDAPPQTDAAEIPPAALPLRASAGGAAPQPDAALDAPPPRSQRARAQSARARRSKLTPTRIDDTPKLRMPENDEPDFVKRSRRKEQFQRLRPLLLGIGSVVLLLLLAAQAAIEFGSVLAARYPGARPALQALCVPLRCRIGLPSSSENLSIEPGELQTLGPGTYSLTTLVRNQGSLTQAWPSIELELVDDANKPLVRRVFGPADYVPAAAIPAGFAARSEHPVRLDFALAGPKPAGYHIFVFYP